jgi:hypothetical protein
MEFPPSHRVLQLQLPSLIVPSSASASEAKHTPMPKMTAANAKPFIVVPRCHPW